MKYKFNLKKWLDNHAKSSNDKEMQSRILLELKNTNEKVKILLDNPIEFEKKTDRTLINIGEDFIFKITFQISKKDCDIVDEKIITEDEYNFLKAIEKFCNKKINHISISYNAAYNLNTIIIDFEKVAFLDEMIELEINTPRFHNIKNEDLLQRDELMKGWE